jgi:hypothetical protein
MRQWNFSGLRLLSVTKLATMVTRVMELGASLGSGEWANLGLVLLDATCFVHTNLKNRTSILIRYDIFQHTVRLTPTR